MKPKRRAELSAVDVIAMVILYGVLFLCVVFFHEESTNNQEKILRRLSVITTLDSLEEQGGKR